MTTPSGSRKLLFFAGLVLILGVLAEVLSLVLISLLNRTLNEPIRRTSTIYAEQTRRLGVLLDDPEQYRTQFDHSLGWRYRAAFANETDTINLQGLRSSREYSEHPASGVLRVAAFGGSFVYANEVDNRQSWSTVLERLYPDMELLNYGVGGYGTDQAWLRFRAEGLRLSPDIVLIGFVPVNLRRIVNVYRRFLSTNESPLLWKPRFILEDDTLRLIPNPITDLDDLRLILREPRQVRERVAHDQWYEPLIYEAPLYDLSASVRLATAFWIRIGNRYLRPNRLIEDGIFNGESTAFQIQLAVLKAFSADVSHQGALPIVLFFPDRESLERIQNGRSPTYQPLADSVRAFGIEVFDLSEAFAAKVGSEGVGPWFAPGNHYSPAGNEIVADWLGQRLLDAPAGRDLP